jgi:HlyD family secretion protein
MFKFIKDFFSLLTVSQRKNFFLFQFLIVIMSFIEITSIISITPFMALVADPTILSRDNFLATLYLKYNLELYEFIFYLGIAVLIFLMISTIVSMIITWRLSMFAAKIGTDIANRLYSHYLDQEWLFHTVESSSHLTKKIATDSVRVGNEIIAPLMQMNARLILVFLILIAMFFYDPFIVIFGLIIFTSGYIILFKFVRVRLEKNNKIISKMLSKRFKLLTNGFGGIRDILLFGRSSYFKTEFNKSSDNLAFSEGTIVGIGRVPRYLIELLSFGSMIALVLYLIKTSNGDLSVILPILSVYGLAAMKLLPSLQVIYNSLTIIKGNLSAYESIKEDLKRINISKIKKNDFTRAVWSKNNEIILKEATFIYPGKNSPALSSISLKIKPNTLVGFVGTSGSGKSTIADLISGLIIPKHGKVIIDGIPLDEQNINLWKKKIGFVSQAIFLIEGTIVENIAFGVSEELIDHKKIEKVLKLSNLYEFVSKLEKGVHSKVGERGVQLSGGQRQRIGIARTLYYDADVLIFDEATSALDGITEKVIMDSIQDFTGKKTLILIAHRLKTIKKCDEIFMMENGKIVDHGDYEYLLSNNKQFKKMSDNA